MGRYDRQIPVFGEDGQKRICRSRVAIAGCGGLGCNVMTQLSISGVGGFAIIDKDESSETNLNRQFIYERAGERKAASSEEWIHRISPSADVRAIDGELTDDNADEFIDGCDIVVDCLDTISSRLILNRAVLRKGITMVHGGVDSMYGQATVVVPGRTPCLGCLLGKDDGSVRPSVGPMVSLIASVQSVEVLKILTGVGTTLAGKLLTIDSATERYDVIDIARRKDCPACGSRSSRQ